MPKRITEAQALTVTEAATPGRVLLQLITPGWGSSGYYSPQVLENAATEQVFPAGTHAYFDHPSESERHDRPERSVRDLVMVLDEDARVDDGGGLVAEAKVIGPYRELVTDPVFMEAVGMSIRAAADTTVGEAEGRKGTIVTQLIEGVSVDLVTRAGRGGRVLAAVESARREAREATSSEVQQSLDIAAAAHDTDSYVHDFDPDSGLVYVRTFEPGMGPGRVWAHPYAYDQPNAVIDWQDATEVRPVTTYVPVGTPTQGEPHQPPVNPAGSTQESEEDTMPQIEESRLAQLEADAGRATTAESERDTAITRAETAEARIAAFERREAIDRVVTDVDGHDTLNAYERRGVTADALEAEELDEDALRTAVETAVAERAHQSGAGHVTGFGQSINGEVSEADIDKTLAGVFGRKEA